MSRAELINKKIDELVKLVKESPCKDTPGCYKY